jgi:hypothetical protein
MVEVDAARNGPPVAIGGDRQCVRSIRKRATWALRGKKKRNRSALYWCSGAVLHLHDGIALERLVHVVDRILPFKHRDFQVRFLSVHEQGNENKYECLAHEITVTSLQQTSLRPSS